MTGEFLIQRQVAGLLFVVIIDLIGLVALVFYQFMHQEKAQFAPDGRTGINGEANRWRNTAGLVLAATYVMTLSMLVGTTTLGFLPGWQFVAALGMVVALAALAGTILYGHWLRLRTAAIAVDAAPNDADVRMKAVTK